MSPEFSLAMGSFLATRALAAMIISLVGGLFVKSFTKSLPYRSSYLVFLWALLRALALTIGLLWVVEYAQLYTAAIVPVARLFGVLILCLLTPYLLNRDLRQYGITQKDYLGVGGLAMVSTVGTLAVMLCCLAIVRAFLP